MKIKYLLTYLIAVLTFTACSESVKNSEIIRSAAIRDAAKVAEAPESSMQREHAVLAIRVREQILRDNGYEQEADLYYSTARSILVDSLHIIEDRATVNEY